MGKGQPITRQQNFRLVQIETNCRRHFKMHVKWKKGLKTLLEKEKLLVTSNFSFSHNVFHSYKSIVCQKCAIAW